jgi:hypothetical protein
MMTTRGLGLQRLDALQQVHAAEPSASRVGEHQIVRGLLEERGP